MRFGHTMQMGLAALLVAGTVGLGGPRAQAQGGGGGFQMPPEMQAKIKAWQKWQESHKNLQTLGDMLYQVQEMEKDPGNALDKKQAGTMLKVVKSWQKKTTMSEDEAKAASKQVGNVLTVKQLKKMSTIETPRQKMQKRGFGGGGAGRPGGGGPGGGGARPGGAGGFKFPDPPAKGWNPFNPDSLPFEQMRPVAKQSMNEFVSNLEKTK